MIIFDSIVFGFISFIFIPPLVIIASSIGLNFFISNSNPFNTSISLVLSCFVIVFTCFCGSILLFFITEFIIFCGNSLFRLFLNCLFFSSSKSLSILSFNFSSDSAGFKSIFNIIFLSLKSNVIAELSLTIDYIEGKGYEIVGPDTPKCVNIISPKSSYIMRFFDVSFN